MKKIGHAGMWNSRSWEALQILRAYGHPYKRQLALGGLGTIGVVAMRLLIPWPLRGVIEIMAPDSRGSHVFVDILPETGDPVLWLGVLYVLCAAGLGLAGVVQRVNLQRFASHTVHDLRAAAVRSASQQPLSARRTPGDLVARIIGDTARIKAGISGILVHAPQNALLFLGVCGLMLWISPLLGLFFIIPGIVVLGIGFHTGSSVAVVADKQRAKEGQYAEAIQEGLTSNGLDPGLEAINSSSAHKEVRTTRLIARATLFEHIVLATGAGLALWMGANQVARGALAPGDIFLFIVYALTVHRRMIQVGRQIARGGKVLASVNRVSALLTRTDPGPIQKSTVPLNSGLCLDHVRLDSLRGWGRKEKPRLKANDLIFHPGTRTVVLGPSGSGKSSLLRLLAGLETPDVGRIFWDDEDVSDRNEVLLSRVSYLPQDPVFPPGRIWQTLGLDGPEPPDKQGQALLRRIGVQQIIDRLPDGLARKAASTSFTRNEARLLSLAGLILAGRSSMWVLDNPLEGLDNKAARRCLETILDEAGDRTVVVALARTVDPGRFDRVILLRRGKVHFDGTSGEWKTWKTDKASSKANQKRLSNR